MTSQLQSQLLGLTLATATAFGCIAYERLVKSQAYFIVGMVIACEYMIFSLSSLFFISINWTNEIKSLVENKWYVLLYLITGVASVCWYFITKRQNVITGAIYDIKYIVVLALIYIMFGQNKLSVNTFVGMILALLSIYFISK